ncbi:MAG: serine/threonine protein kinase [Deltaproteobacteria bacterium]|nr:serine/threonine protein kinase [Deltaproteobacteria bacterium]
MELPHIYGRYTLLERLASGGMAEVYLARYAGERGFTKIVAIKRILPTWSDDPHFVAMLIDEAHALSHLQHQNIVQVYELGKEGETYFIAMEFVGGMDCRTLLRRMKASGRDLTRAQSLYLITEVLKGLAFAHTQVDEQGRELGIVHRDISPQNILISFSGEVKIADFGIAKGAHRHRQTRATQVKGKYAYMAPEQALGAPVDPRADLFATGALLYELLTGVPCFDGPNDLAILERVKHAAMPPNWERPFEPTLREILKRALAREPAQRYPTAHAFLEEVTRYTMTRRLLIHGLDLAQQLRALFPDEVARAAARLGTGKPRGITRAAGNAERSAPIERTRGYTTGVPRQDRWRGWSVLLEAGRRVLLSAGAIGGVTLAALAPNHHPAVAMRTQLRQMPATVAPAKVDTTSASESVAQAALLPVLQPPAVIEQPRPAATHGTLSIQARPWGTVTIPGVMSGKEAPIGMKLAAGSYPVRVTHSATQRSVAVRAVIRPGGKTTCFATFADEATIRCR